MTGVPLMETALDEAPTSIMIMTAGPTPGEARIVFVNRAFTLLTGFGESEIRGRSPWILQGPRTDRAVLAALLERMAHGEPFVGVMTNGRKDGTPVDLEWHVAPVHGPDGAVTHFIAIHSDVTGRKQADEALRQAKAIAEAADHAKSAFFAAMSHELRTPLTAIIGFSELLEDGTGGPLTDRQKKYVTNILGSGRTLLDLVEQVLDITRVGVGRMVLTPAMLDVAEALADVEMLVRALAAKKGATLVIEVPEPLPRISADAPKLKQVLFGLMTNALRHVTDGGAVIVRARPEPAGSGETGPCIQIDVHDNGPGLGPEDRERLLNDFELIGSSYTPESRSGGMGLALARKLVELHGGRMWIESEPGVGTAVRFALPVAARPRAMREATAEQAGGDAEPLVLVVEDDPSASELLGHYLAEGGYTPAHAFTCADGLAMVRSRRPAAVTIDPAMPDGDGLDILTEMRRDPNLRDIPVVVVSVSPPRPLPADFGVLAWIEKPVSKAELLGVLKRGQLPLRATHG